MFRNQTHIHYHYIITCLDFNTFLKRKRTGSDSVLQRKPLYQQIIQQPIDNTKTPPNTSITQRLWTDLEWSVGVRSAIQLV